MSDKLRDAMETVIFLLGALIVSVLIVKYVGQRTVVDGSSMNPTLYHNDNLWVNKLTYQFEDPERFDIVVLRPYDFDPKVYYIKRVIALPGETIWIDRNGDIYIDGEILEEDYGMERILPENIGRASEPITLGEDEFFVMGDNRNNSGDSRSRAVGNVKRDRIIGKAWIRIWPLNKFGVVEKRK